MHNIWQCVFFFPTNLLLFILEKRNTEQRIFIFLQADVFHKRNNNRRKTGNTKKKEKLNGIQWGDDEEEKGPFFLCCFNVTCNQRHCSSGSMWLCVCVVFLRLFTLKKKDKRNGHKHLSSQKTYIHTHKRWYRSFVIFYVCCIICVMGKKGRDKDRLGLVPFIMILPVSLYITSK